MDAYFECMDESTISRLRGTPESMAKAKNYVNHAMITSIDLNVSEFIHRHSKLRSLVVCHSLMI